MFCESCSLLYFIFKYLFEGFTLFHPHFYGVDFFVTDIAFYYFIQFDGAATVPSEIESRIRLMENVVRYLVVRQDEK
mgnify:CR=1 FL=1